MVQDLGYDVYDPTGNSIEALLNKINTIQSQVSSVVTGIDKITGVTITSEILQTATTIKISALHLNLVGAVTITDFDTPLQTSMGIYDGWKMPGSTTINGANIETGTIIASKISVSSLSAISANLGTITAGSISANLINGGTISGVNINVNTDLYVGNNIRLGTAGDTATTRTINMLGSSNITSRFYVGGYSETLVQGYSVSMQSVPIINASSVTVNPSGVYLANPNGIYINGLISQQSGTFYVSSAGVISSSAVYNNTIASSANMFIDASGNFCRSTSSIKYKKDVEDLWETEYSKVLDLRPVWYRSKAESDRPDWSYVGLIAEEVHVIEPRLVHYKDWYTEVDGVRVPIDESLLEPDGVQYDRIAVMLLPIIKRQQQELLSLRNDVELLKAR